MEELDERYVTIEQFMKLLQSVDERFNMTYAALEAQNNMNKALEKKIQLVQNAANAAIRPFMKIG